jgi:hypothetical protein
MEVLNVMEISKKNRVATSNNAQVCLRMKLSETIRV